MTTTAPRSLDDKRRLVAELLLAKHRKQFPVLSKLTYLNFGVQGALSTAARQTVDRSLARQGEIAPFSTDDLLERRDAMTRVRTALGAELGVAPETLALLENTSVGMDTVLWGLPWSPGDRLVLTDHEYPGVVAAVDELAHRHGLETAHWAVGHEQDDDALLAALEPLLAAPTRLLVVSHVLWDTGRVLPLAAIARRCRAAGVRLLVDAAQAVGVLDLRDPAHGVAACDFYAFTGHKWWCGPEGAGGLYVAPEALEALRPTFLGGRSLALGTDGFDGWRNDAGRYEISSSCLGLHQALVTALETRAGWGDAATCLARIRGTAHDLWQGLGELPGVERLQTAPPEVGLVFFRVPGRPALDVARFLEARGVLIRTIPHLDALRASVHYLTLPGEIEALLTRLGDYLDRRTGSGEAS